MRRMSEKEIWEKTLKNIEEDAELLRALNTGTKKVKRTPERKRK